MDHWVSIGYTSILTLITAKAETMLISQDKRATMGQQVKLTDTACDMDIGEFKIW